MSKFIGVDYVIVEQGNSIMRCKSGSESPMQRCQMAARDHQKIPQSNLKVNYLGTFSLLEQSLLFIEAGYEPAEILL